MTKFHFIGKKENGDDIDDIRESKGRFELAKDLRGEGITPISIEEIKEKRGFSLDKVMSVLNRIKLKDLVIFTNNLGAMVEAGLSLVRSLGVLEKQSSNPKLKKIVGVLIEQVNSGNSLSSSLSAFPKSFPQIMISMIRAGEESGKLPDSLDIISNQLNKNYELRRKIKGAMIYPAIILVVIFIIGVLMMLYLVPTLAATFEELNAPLPVTTRFIISLSSFITTYTIYLATSLVLGILLLIRFLKSKVGKRAFSYVLLHIPVIKNITKYANSAITMRTLSSLISSGVGMVEAIGITEEVLQNTYYKDVMSDAKKDVQKGLTFSSTITKYENIYPVLVSEMSEVGEETGKLSEMLNKGASFYEGEVDSMTKNISTIIEPVLMVFIGIVVGFFAISMIQPMYSLSEFI